LGSKITSEIGSKMRSRRCGREGALRSPHGGR
jgi:hypothetical protein